MTHDILKYGVLKQARLSVTYSREHKNIFKNYKTCLVFNTSMMTEYNFHFPVFCIESRHSFVLYRTRKMFRAPTAIVQRVVIQRLTAELCTNKFKVLSLRPNHQRILPRVLLRHATRSSQTYMAESNQRVLIQYLTCDWWVITICHATIDLLVRTCCDDQA